MNIGFFGNANNYPFMLARAIRKLGHDVTFVVDSTSILNRPEFRYDDIVLPYPSWIVDCSPINLWNYPRESGEIEKAVGLLKECDAVVLNEFGLSLWGRIQKPAFAFLTGTDIEVLADPKYAYNSTGVMTRSGHLLKDILTWRRRKNQRNQEKHLLRLVAEQRKGIQESVGVRYFPKGMLNNADRPPAR